MIKLTILGLYAFLMSACSYGSLPGTHQGYFADAFNCNQSTQHKEKVFIDKTVGTVDIPMGTDGDAFAMCMQLVGRPVARVDVTEYLATSRACLQAASATPNHDASYADCIARSHLQVDVISGD
ncbi:MAG: hypothetical protein NTV43_04435 [Methylococcales bacterium]|nr:hypothetical protein [Methylococcales bacterium]